MFFLLRRLTFIDQFYARASSTFEDRKQKIEIGSEPFIAPYGDDGEPAFMDEWLEDLESIQVMGGACLSMLAVTFQIYLKTYRDQISIPFSEQVQVEFKKRGWFNGYKAFFQIQVGLDFGNCPCNFDILEELVLVRNSVQHPEALLSNSPHFSATSLKKLVDPYFSDSREHSLYRGEDRSWLLPLTIHVPYDKLKVAISEVRKFAEWLEQTRL